MPLQATSGAASYDAFGGGAPAAVPTYIEDVMSVWLYTGAGSTNQNIVNGIDLAGKGGLVWIKNRSVADTHLLFDTLRGATRNLSTAQSGGQGTLSQSLTSFNSNGFTGRSDIGPTGDLMASWTFREQSKFFDVVTYTGNATNRTVSHNLGSVPGCIIVKRTDDTADWQVYHRSNANTEYMVLNSTAAVATGATRWNSTTPTDSVFSLGTDASVNASGGTYVAYLFAHNAGGFGLTGTDNVISCGSYTGDGTNGQSISLGYEPQWLLIKRTDTSASWFLQDNMRPFSVTATEWLQPNTANAESAGGVAYVSPTATGFTFTSGGSSAYNASGGTYIYIAIRRGPMKVPTDATKVFAPIARTGTGAAASITGLGFAPDFAAIKARSTNTNNTWLDKLRGLVRLQSDTTNPEDSYPSGITAYNNTGVSLGAAGHVNGSGETFINYLFGRAPSFFDEVCYMGNGSTQNITHNLAAVPELMIVKERNDSTDWRVYIGSQGNQWVSYLNLTYQGDSGQSTWNSTTPTSTVFSLGVDSSTNGSGDTYVNYLFATCPGVSKVGSYTGNGTTQAIACGFTGGARFVLIKRTDSTGGWYVYDTARGMTVLTDPYLFLNSTAAESATLGSVITTTGGFTVDATILAAVNTNGASYIFLAIA